jgi:hypothetical protein
MYLEHPVAGPVFYALPPAQNKKQEQISFFEELYFYVDICNKLAKNEVG